MDKRIVIVGAGVAHKLFNIYYHKHKNETEYQRNQKNAAIGWYFERRIKNR